LSGKRGRTGSSIELKGTLTRCPALFEILSAKEARRQIVGAEENS
jgi:hypothetical protein